MSVLMVNEQNFETVVLQAEVPVLVDFYAEWCGPCKMMSPVLDQLATELADRALIVKVNVDESPKLSQKFNVMNVPTLVALKKGEVINKVVGARPKPALMALLELD